MRVTFSPVTREWSLKERGLDFADAEIVFAERHTILADERFE